MIHVSVTLVNVSKMSKTYKIGKTPPEKVKGGRGSSKYAKQQINEATYKNAFKNTQKKMEKFTYDKIAKAFIEGLKNLSNDKRKLRIKNDNTKETTKSN